MVDFATERWPSLDPNEEDIRSLNWAPYLPSGETLDTVTWAVPASLTKVSQSKNAANTIANIVLSVFTASAGDDVEIECVVVTTPSAYDYKKSVILPVRNH